MLPTNCNFSTSKKCLRSDRHFTALTPDAILRGGGGEISPKRTIGRPQGGQATGKQISYVDATFVRTHTKPILQLRSYEKKKKLEGERWTTGGWILV